MELNVLKKSVLHAAVTDSRVKKQTFKGGGRFHPNLLLISLAVPSQVPKDLSGHSLFLEAKLYGLLTGS